MIQSQIPPKEEEKDLPPLPPSDDQRAKEADRKAKWRAQKKAQQDPNYQMAPFDLAKQLLKEMEAPDLTEVLSREAIKDKVTDDERRRLQFYVYHLKSTRKKEQQLEAIKSEQQMMITEKGRTYVNQETYELNQALLMVGTEQERQLLIKETIDTNIFMFLKYMETYKEPFPGFLKIVIDLQSQVDSASFTELFVRVCKFQRIEELRVSSEMILNAMQFLVENKKDDNAANGCLRLIYNNKISLASFPIQLLVKFQEAYDQTILRFFKSLSIYKQNVCDSLPPTAFCFSSPILRAIQEGGRVFYNQVPLELMPYLIEITCYSFNDSEESFEKFLTVFKEGSKSHFNHLAGNNFTGLLQRILDLTKERRAEFFQSLNHAAAVLDQAFKFVKERKVQNFTESTIEALVRLDFEGLTQISKRPSALLASSQPKLSILIKEVKKLNPALARDLDQLDRELDQQSMAYFHALGISTLTPQQALGYNFVRTAKASNKWVLQLATGTGKTSLCFALACQAAKQDLKVMVVNCSDELTFRDFQKADTAAKAVDVPVSLIQEAEKLERLPRGITFASTKVFLKLAEGRTGEDLRSVLVIFDEIDSFLLGEGATFEATLALFKSIHRLVGLTGSDLKEFHAKAIEKLASCTLVKMSAVSSASSALIFHHQEVYPIIKDFRNRIDALCKAQVAKTPIIIIGEDNSKLLHKQLQKSGLSVYSLWEQRFVEANSTLQIFTKRQANKYPVFIVNDSQGRGLDFGSSSEIEANGGVYLLIAQLPPSFLQYSQYLGRTGRIQNKGQGAVILHDGQAKNSDGPIYLQHRLESLRSEDQKRISQWLSVSKEDVRKESVTLSDADEEGEEEVSQSESSPLVTEEDDVKKMEEPEKSAIESEENMRLPCLGKRSLARSRSESEESKGSSKRLAKQREKEKAKAAKARLKDIERRGRRDVEYFEGYSSLEIHQEMISDTVRTEAYREAIKKSVANQVVVDVGAGTGILSIFAAEAGAERVFAIEKSNIVKVCKEQIYQKRLQDKIEVMHADADEVTWLLKHADVLVSEWMGYFLLFERMLPSVLTVRDTVFKKDGIMIPGRARMIVAGVAPDRNLYGLDLSERKLPKKAVPQVVLIQKERMVTKPLVLQDLDLKTIPSNFDSFEFTGELEVTGEEDLAGLVGWFDVEMTSDSWLSTAPDQPPTHWRQVYFPLPGAKAVKAGQKLPLKFSYQPPEKDHRGMQVDVSIIFREEDERIDQQYEMV